MTNTNTNKFEQMIDKCERHISFDPFFIPAIISGDKTQTRRLKHKGYDSDQLLYVKAYKDQPKAYSPLIVRAVDLPEGTPWVHRWDDMRDEWAVADGFADREEFFQWVQGNYPDENFTGDTLLYATAFEVVAVNPDSKLTKDTKQC